MVSYKLPVAGWPLTGKPGKVREFQSGQGKVRQTEICFSVQLTYQWHESIKKSWSCSFWQLVGLDFGYVHHWHSCTF